MFDGRSDHYVSVGLSAMRLIQLAVRGRKAPERILDLPCGHGRVTRMLRACYPSAQITACDLDRSGVEFAVQQFGALGVYSQEDFRTFSLADRYDLIWVGSLITHLSGRQTRQFLDFAARHLAPDGTLVITSHGSHVFECLRSNDYGLTDAAVHGLLADARIHGYGYRNYPGGSGYGLSLTERTWFEDLFADGPLRLDDYREVGWDDHQDALVLRLRAPVRTATPLNRFLSTLGKGAPPQVARYDNDQPEQPSAQAQEAIDRKQLTGFDEAWYLNAYPDVATAVAQGRVASGREHYCTYGWREGRAFGDDRLTYKARPRRADVLAAAGKAPLEMDRIDFVPGTGAPAQTAGLVLNGPSHSGGTADHPRPG